MSAKDVLARMLAEHDWCWTRRDQRDQSPIAIGCECGEWSADLNGEPGWAAHREHVAAAQVAALREAGYLPESVETACRDCGADWRPVRRGECAHCGSDAGPLPVQPDQVGEWEPIEDGDS